MQVSILRYKSVFQSLSASIKTDLTLRASQLQFEERNRDIHLIVVLVYEEHLLRDTHDLLLLPLRLKEDFKVQFQFSALCLQIFIPSLISFFFILIMSVPGYWVLSEVIMKGIRHSTMFLQVDTKSKVKQNIHFKLYFFRVKTRQIIFTKNYL